MRARQFETLAVDEAERFGAAIGDARHPREGKHVDGAIVGGVARQAPAMHGGGENIFEHRHAAEGARNLMRPRQPHSAAFGGWRRCHVAPQESHRAAGRRVGADEQAEQGRFAGAVGTDDADRFVRRHREIHVIEHQRGRRSVW